MTVVLSSTLLCISFTYKIAILGGPLLLHVICSLVAEDAEAAYYAQRAEEARFDRTKKMEDKNVPARRRRKLAPNKHQGPKSICQFIGGEGFHYSTFYTSSVICSYDCLSSSVWAGLGGGGGGGGGVVRRDAYSGICYGVCCCC